ncbi:twin-arginine translocase subunit TatC [Paenibacillus sp. N4]|uniref:twin-arginine translocase subunit TatC n=1 Tax=Paenibacillus vietnamensis TaxID=2590547 RepID=UPI001CD167A1|nr:twin-arginine translocase subunit TatC [Paenibacillus vietnamensis]MCA0758452.1 twin-arginine translocase subunit TatC [Paenibacillus vietnamensis]
MQAQPDFIEHLTELRKRILYALAAFLMALCGGMAMVRPALAYLQRSYAPESAILWNAFSPFDALQLYVQTGVTIGAGASLPFALLQAWLFVKPALTEEERKAVPWLIPFALFLFLLGLVFSWFVVFPMALQFASSITRSMGLVETYGAAQYVQFLLRIVLPLSVVFEYPVVVVFLARIGLITPERLRKSRKAAYVMLVTLSTVLTPPDFLSAFMVLIPLIILFEASFPLARWAGKKRGGNDDGA